MAPALFVAFPFKSVKPTDRMHSQDDIHYALEMTKVLREPDRLIATFGETRFEFQLVSELMDRVGEVRIRTGHVEAMRPRILRPESYNEIALDGFDSTARAHFDKLVNKLRAEGNDMAFLQYGFQFRRGEVHEEVVKDSMSSVQDRLLQEIRRNGNPVLAIIEGVDDAWEVSLFKFAFDMIMRSHEVNIFDFQRDFRRRGLL